MKRVVCGSFGNIYYAKILGGGLMSDTDRVEVTEDAITAVIDHITLMEDYKKNDGFSGYEYDKRGGGSVVLAVYDTDKYKVVKKESKENV